VAPNARVQRSNKRRSSSCACDQGVPVPLVFPRLLPRSGFFPYAKLQTQVECLTRKSSVASIRSGKTSAIATAHPAYNTRLWGERTLRELWSLTYPRSLASPCSLVDT